MNHFLEELKLELSKLEKSTRPESNEKRMKALFDIAERGKSIDKLTDDCLVVINNLIEEHSIDKSDDLMTEIRNITADIIRQRIGN